jgi:hypothetical protein
VPRDEQMPRPKVEALRGDGAVGATVRWPDATDTILFSRGTATLGSTELGGSAAFLRRRGEELRAWGLLDGTLLSAGDEELARSDAPMVQVHMAD